MNKRLLTSFTVLGFLLLSIATPVFAADLLITPSSGSYSVGRDFTVLIKVSTPDQSANAFSGEIGYPTDKLRVQNVSKSNSIINYWPTEPSVSSGIIKYEGVSVNPGYTGSSGTLLQITFRTLAPGVATVRFKSASVLANDGLATSILNNLGIGSYTIKTLDVPIEDIPTKVTAVPGLPEAPQVTSSTHPDQTLWYKNNTPLINWTIPSGISGVGLMVNETATTIPTVRSLGRVTGYNIAKLTDGEWYAHVRYLNGNGWGTTAHYRFGIDTVPPTDFAITPNIPEKDATTATLSLSTTDTVSGIDRYILSIDGGAPIVVPATMVWETPVLPPGNHTVVGEVFDKAGNSKSVTATFTTTGIPAPTITTYPKELKTGETLIITGSAHPKSTVLISITEKTDNKYSFGSIVYQKNDSPDVEEVVADAQGAFTFIYDKKVKSGTYTLSAVTKFGVYESASSNSVTINVTQSLFMRLLGLFIQYFNIIVSCIAIISLFISVMLYREIKKIHRHIGYPEGGPKPMV